jgi:hypothetical protein
MVLLAPTPVLCSIVLPATSVTIILISSLLLLVNTRLKRFCVGFGIARAARSGEAVVPELNFGVITEVILAAVATVTVKLQVALLPVASVALQKMVLVPTFNATPARDVFVVLNGPFALFILYNREAKLQLSVAVALNSVPDIIYLFGDVALVILVAFGLQVTIGL